MKRTLLITTTAVLIALIIGVQAVTAALGQLVTGSLVNLVLIVAAMIGGLPCGLAVALVSPVAAKLLGIGPLWTIIPFIIAGNAVIVTVWHLLGKTSFANPHIIRVISAVAGAVCKFLTLYIGIVLVAVPLLLDLPEKQAATVTNLFSLPQLFTALIGGGMAVIILPVLTKAVKARIN